MTELEQTEEPPEAALEDTPARKPHIAVLIAGWVSVVAVPFVAPVIGLLLYWRYRARAGLWITLAAVALIALATVLRLTT